MRRKKAYLHIQNGFPLNAKNTCEPSAGFAEFASIRGDEVCNPGPYRKRHSV